jgi:hypothetical protein
VSNSSSKGTMLGNYRFLFVHCPIAFVSAFSLWPLFSCKPLVLFNWPTNLVPPPFCGKIAHQQTCSVVIDPVSASDLKGNKSGRAVGPPRSDYLPAVAAVAMAATSVGAAEVAATETRFAGLRFVHLDVSALELGIVELLYGFGSILRVRHLDKTEAFGLARKFVHDDGDTLHLTDL